MEIVCSLAENSLLLQHQLFMWLMIPLGLETTLCAEHVGNFDSGGLANGHAITSRRIDARSAKRIFTTSV